MKKFLSQLKSTKLICLICYPTSIYSYPISIYNFRAAINIFVKQKLSSVSLFKKREMCAINSYLACSILYDNKGWRVSILGNMKSDRLLHKNRMIVICKNLGLLLINTLVQNLLFNKKEYRGSPNSTVFAPPRNHTIE